MEQTDNTGILRQALAPTETKRLPSNFAYTTMRRIRLEQQKSEQRGSIVQACIVVAVSLLGIGGLVCAFGSLLWQSLVAMLRQPDAFSLVPATLFCLVFFALLNHWLSRRFGSGVANDAVC